MKFLLCVLIAGLVSACRTDTQPHPQPAREIVAVTLECTRFDLAGFEVWKKHKLSKKPDEVYDSYAFLVVAPELYAGKSIELYLPQRIAGRERAVHVGEHLRVAVDKLEIERLLRGSKTNVGLMPSPLVQDAVTRQLRNLIEASKTAK